MFGGFSRSIGTESSTQDITNVSWEFELDALKSLTMLLIREVDSLGESRNQNSNQFLDGRINLSREMERFEIDLIRHAMIRARGNQRAAAKFLGTKVTTLNSKIKRFALEDYSILGRINNYGGRI